MTSFFGCCQVNLAFLFRKRQFSIWWIHLAVKRLRSHQITSVIRQKGKSQNGCFKKTKHAKFSEKQTFLTPWYAHVRVSWKARFEIRPFALLPTIDQKILRSLWRSSSEVTVWSPFSVVVRLIRYFLFCNGLFSIKWLPLVPKFSNHSKFE